MNCEQACHLLDDYLENELRRYDRQRLETHLASCSRCVEELRSRSSFDQAIRQTLAISVQRLALSADASTRMIRVAQDNVHQAIWSHHVLVTFKTVASLAAVALALVGLLFLVRRIPDSIGVRPATLLPVNRLALSEPRPITLAPLSRPALPELQPVTESQADQPALTLGEGDLRIEPSVLHPSDWFTITIFLHSDLSQPAEIARFDLEISGPPGHYRFPLAVKGPLPAHGLSILEITPAHLASLCEKRYLISPAEMFNQPGAYTVRVTLFNPVSTP